MRWFKTTEFLSDLEKSRIALYGIMVFLLILLSIVLDQLFKKPTEVNMPPSKPKQYEELVPIKSAEKLFLLKLYTAEFSKTNILSPFYTDKFKPQHPAQTNLNSTPPPPPPPKFYKVQIKYMGMIQNSEGLKKAFFLVNSNIVTATTGMNILSNILATDFNTKQAVLTCPDKTNVIMFNKEFVLEIPIK